LSGYTQYVLTVEPNDGDPAPGPHILEGQVRLRTLSVGKSVKGAGISPTATVKTTPKVTKEQFLSPLRSVLAKVSRSRLEKLQSQLPAAQVAFEKSISVSDEKRERILAILEALTDVLEEIL